MKTKTFGSVVTEIEAKLQNWLNENKGVEVKHLAIGLNAASDWSLIVIIYNEVDCMEMPSTQKKVPSKENKGSVEYP
jgi:hypothetical protein